MLYVLAFPEFAPHTLQAIDGFRRLHEPERASRVRPHVTLVFGLHTAQSSEVIAKCRAAAGTTGNLTVTFAQTEVVFDPFEHTSKLFLICERGKDVLTALHHLLYDAPYRTELRKDIPYKPHMTIATHPERARIEQLDASVLGPFPIRGMIHALDIVETEAGRLRTLARIPLSG